MEWKHLHTKGKSWLRSIVPKYKRISKMGFDKSSVDLFSKMVEDEQNSRTQLFQEMLSSAQLLHKQYEEEASKYELLAKCAQEAANNAAKLKKVLDSLMLIASDQPRLMRTSTDIDEYQKSANLMNSTATLPAIGLGPIKTQFQDIIGSNPQLELNKEVKDHRNSEGPFMPASLSQPRPPPKQPESTRPPEIPKQSEVNGQHEKKKQTT